jgi:replicative DNA helicase
VRDDRSREDREMLKTAERGLVGLALMRPEKTLELDLEPQHFFDTRLGDAWAAIRDLVGEGRQVDELAVVARFESLGRPGGDRLFLELGQCTLGSIPTLPHDWALLVREASVTRQVLGAFSMLEVESREGLRGAELLSVTLQRLAAIHVEQPAGALPIGALAKARYVELIALAESKAKGLSGLTGITTGLEKLDAVIGGLQRGIVTVVAGRPSMGKSSFAMSVVDAVSAAGIGAHVFSLEDTRSAYVDRSLSRTSGIAADVIRSCEFGRTDITALGVAAQKLHDRRGWLVDDRSGITAEELVRSVRRELKRNETQLVVVDYVQLLKPPPGFGSPTDRTKVIDHATNVLADAAKQDNLAYLVLAQLNRDCEKRENKRPLLSDLKQCGTIEERAKAVLMLYRPAYYREVDPHTKEPVSEDQIEPLVRKNNQGRTGKVLARWHGPTTRID